MILKLLKKIARTLSRFTIVLFVLFVIALGAFVWSYAHYQATKGNLASLENGQQMSPKQIEHFTRLVGKHIVLPEGQPTIAIIKDISALSGQSFFKNAQNGDIVLVYPTQAFIYSPSRHILVNVGPVVGNPSDQVQKPVVPESQTVSVEIRNGSGTPGKGASVASDVKSLPGYMVTEVKNAKNTSYSSTIIVNLSGKDVSLLEKAFDATAVKSLPSGEAGSTADVVVIIGNK